MIKETLNKLRESNVETREKFIDKCCCKSIELSNGKRCHIDKITQSLREVLEFFVQEFFILDYDLEYKCLPFGGKNTWRIWVNLIFEIPDHKSKNYFIHVTP